MARRLAAVTAAVVALVLFAAVHAASPMPYRPGYGLGSWLPEKVVAGMRREAAARSELLLTTNLDNDIQSMARELKLAMEKPEGIDDTALPPPLNEKEYAGVVDKLQAARADVWKRKVGALDNLIGQISGQLKALDAASKDLDGDGVPKTGEFTTFASGAESAADWATSIDKHRERAYDSFNVDVHFVEHKQSSDSRTASTQANAIARKLTHQNNTATGSTNYLMAEAAKRAKEQAEEFLADNSAVGTLLLTSFATHRKVLQFNRLNINTDKLWRAWNYYRTDDTVADPFTQHATFEKQFQEESKRDMGTAKKIHMVSEMFKGSALVGMVHFVQTNSTRTTDLAKELREGAHGASNGTRFGDAGSHTTESADRRSAEQEASRIIKLASDAKYKVHFSIVSVGYIPKMTPSDVQLAVRQMGNFDPGKFAVPAFVDTKQGDDAPALAAVQSNMQAVVHATIQAVGTVEQNKMQVLDMTTFMTAFDDYAKAAQAADDATGIGAPIGMNVRDFTKLDVMSALANKYLGTGMKLAVDQSDAPDAKPEDATSTATGTPPPTEGAQQPL